jgi:hypothetical protein
MKRSGLRFILVTLVGACLLCGGCTYFKPPENSTDQDIPERESGGYLPWGHVGPEPYSRYDSGR